jgi:hypothetical protein
MYRVLPKSLAACVLLSIAQYSAAADIQFLCKFAFADGSSPVTYLIDGPSEESKIGQIAYDGEVYLSQYVNVETGFVAQGTLIDRAGIYVFLEENMSDNYFSVTVFKGVLALNAIYSFFAVDGYLSEIVDPAPTSMEQNRGNCQELL